MRYRRRNRPEQAIQRALCDHLRMRASKDIFWFHPANGGARTVIEASILKACGVRAGVPDLVLVKSGQTYGLELKAEGGRLSDSQKLAHEEMQRAGAVVAVATGIDQALATLEEWGMLRGSTS